MGKYVVTTGQNIYDVALHLTGSAEGVIDLMMCNPELSMERTLNAGDELIYTDGFVIDPDAVATYKSRGIVPAGSERKVYPKVFDTEPMLEMRVTAQQISASFEAAGSGILQIDWGDNSPPETIALTNVQKRISHRFDNVVGTQRRIRFYGDGRFTHLDLSGLMAESILSLGALEAEQFFLHNGPSRLEFVQMLRGTYRMNLSGMKIASLLPVAECRQLMILDLSAADVLTRILDEFLIALVVRHYGRRSCTLTLPAAPSGVYREPLRDAGQNYLITSGMEAIWLLTHESSWNEGGYWSVTIGDEHYTYEPDDTNHSGGEIGNN